MGRTLSLSRALWSFALASSACGRIGFDSERVAADGAAGAPVAMISPPAQLTSTCGDLAPAASLMLIANSGDAPLIVTSATATAGFSVQASLPIAIDPGGQTMIAVAPPVAVIGTDLGGATKSGTVTLTTNDAAGSHVVPVSTTIVGANFTVTDLGGGNPDLAFSGASGTCPQPEPLLIKNTGNAAAMVNASGSGAIVLTGFSGGTISANAVASSAAYPVSEGPCSGIGNVTYTVTGATCTVTPIVLAGSFNIVGASSCLCS